MGQNLIGQFAPLLKRWLCNVWLDFVIENWFLSVDQCLLQALEFSVHLMDLLSILLRYNGFTGTQKAVVDQIGSRPSVIMPFFGASLALGNILELLLSLTTELVIASCSIKSTFYHTSQCNQEMVCSYCIG